MKESLKRKLAFLFFVVVMGLVAWVFTSKGVRRIYIYFAVKSWKTTQGVVTRSKYSVDTSGGPRSRTVRVEIDYEYAVDGKTYQGELHPDDRSRSYLHKDFPLNKTIKVWIDPSDPAKSVISPGLDQSVITYMVIGLFSGFCALICLAGVIFNFEEPEKPSDDDQSPVPSNKAVD